MGFFSRPIRVLLAVGLLAALLTAVVILARLGNETPPEKTVATGKPPTGSRAGRPPAVPPYEEPPGSAEQRLARRVDSALYRALALTGATDDDITFLTLDFNNGPRPSAAGLAKISVRLKRSWNSAGLKGLLRRGIDVPGVRLAFDGPSDGRLVLTVYIRGRPTHLVTFHPLTKSPPTKPAPVVKPTKPVKAPRPVVKPLPPPPPPPARPGSHKGLPLVAIIIDDIGYRQGLGRRFMDLDLLLTFSVLPMSPHAARMAGLAHRRGRQVMLHLPLEPNTYPGLNPGRGALFLRMSPETMRTRFNRALSRVPRAVGVNNHMGSRFTRDARAMGIVLGEIKRRGLFFVDSLTSLRSVAWRVARRLGVRTARRTVFLDNYHRDRSYIRLQLLKLIQIARRRKTGVIAIGHPHQATYDVLRAYRRRLKSKVELVPVSRLVR